jgi:hypothetical protein
MKFVHAPVSMSSDLRAKGGNATVLAIVAGPHSQRISRVRFQAKTDLARLSTVDLSRVSESCALDGERNFQCIITRSSLLQPNRVSAQTHA